MEGKKDRQVTCLPRLSGSRGTVGSRKLEAVAIDVDRYTTTGLKDQMVTLSSDDGDHDQNEDEMDQ